MSVLLALLAVVAEALAGYPPALYAAIGHPVTWIGALISRLETALNHPAWPFARRRLAGVGALLALLTVTGGLAWALQAAVIALCAPLASGLGLVVLAILASSLIAQHSLDEHVRAVADALESGGVAAGRTAVGRIVGRDTGVLDEAGIARAAVESLAENFSDGVVAPVFWLAVGGLPGAALYKAINTADSMIGHRNDRYLAFGWAAARLDDLVNLPASRLTALWLLIATAAFPAASARSALQAIWRDAGRHKSPNAGWPEAALAGALGFKLAGPRIYGGVLVQDATMGDGRAALGPADIRQALALYRVACAVQAITLATIAAAGAALV